MRWREGGVWLVCVLSEPLITLITLIALMGCDGVLVVVFDAVVFGWFVCCLNR